MNALAVIELIGEIAPLVEDVLNSQEGQALVAAVIGYFDKHPVSASASQAIEQAVLPAVNVPPTQSLD